jgi:gamma-D-glutamyl-L-lysine dipeptidyl-peptidase
MYAISPISIIPVRAQPSERSEMVTQILFGELVEVLNTNKKLQSLHPGWSHVRCDWDGYLGWVTTKQLQFLQLQKPDFQNIAFNYEIMQAAMNSDYSIPITIGATLPDYDGLSFEIGEKKFTFSGQVIDAQNTKANADLLLKIARRFLYAPYLWGGRSPFGIDCSGLVQVCYKMLGIALPRDAYQQAEIGETIDFIEYTQQGDLAYFVNDSNKITHVGIIIANNQIIHASGRVRIDVLDHQGIFNTETQTYSHRLRFVKRILPTDNERLKQNQETAVKVKIGEEIENTLQLF